MFYFALSFVSVKVFFLCILLRFPLGVCVYFTGFGRIIGDFKGGKELILARKSSCLVILYFVYTNVGRVLVKYQILCTRNTHLHCSYN